MVQPYAGRTDRQTDAERMKFQEFFLPLFVRTDLDGKKEIKAK